MTVEVEALPDWVVGTFNGYYTLEGYHGPSKEHGVYNKYEHDYTDGRIHWEMSGPTLVKISSVGQIQLSWPEPKDVIGLTEIERDEDGNFVFCCRFGLSADGPYLDYEQGEVIGKIYINKSLSRQLGYEVGEVVYLLSAIDGHNDYYEEVYVAQKDLSLDSLIRNQLINVGGRRESFEFRNVKSTKDVHSYSFRGSLSVGFDNKGNVISSWTPNDYPALVKKTNNTKFIVTSYDKNNGTVLGEIGVFVIDFNDEADEYLEYGLFFDVEIKDGVLNIKWDDSRVIIHEYDE
jgi:hypothetical protein